MTSMPATPEPFAARNYMPPPPFSDDSSFAAPLAAHRGAIDQSNITSCPPAVVMEKITRILSEMGIVVDVENPFKLQCTRPSKQKAELAPPSAAAEFLKSLSSDSLASPPCEEVLPATPPIYGDNPSIDVGDEVKFSIELTRIEGLVGTHSLDIRRMRGNLRSYKFIYETVRE